MQRWLILWDVLLISQADMRRQYCLLVSNEDSNIYMILRLCIVHVTHADMTTCLLERLYALH